MSTEGNVEKQDQNNLDRAEELCLEALGKDSPERQQCEENLKDILNRLEKQGK